APSYPCRSRHLLPSCRAVLTPPPFPYTTLFRSALGKDTAEQLVYLPRHLLMDRSSRFFSCSVQPPRCCSTGRSRQILSLRATRSWPSLWMRWNSATSCCALRSAVGLGKVSVTVLPATRRARRK